MADAGTIGEDQFALWCSQAGLTATPARRDKYGWDFLVQFPRVAGQEPVETRPPQLMCMVQVKTTTIGERRAPIKMDNWERMVSEPIPWFVVAIALDGVIPREVHLVHISEAWTIKVLTRLRELRKKDSSIAESIHRKKMDVSWTPADRVASMDGAGIRSMIVQLVQSVGPDQFRYGEAKTDWYTNAGYEDNPQTIKAVMSAQSKRELYERLRDFAVGLVDRIPIDLLTVTSNRFGIPIEEVNLTEASDEEKLGYLGNSELAPHAKTSITIYDGERTVGVTFSCDLFASHWAFPFLPREYWRFRFVSPCVEAIMDHPKRTKAEFAISFRVLTQFDRAVAVGDLLKLGRAIRIIDDASERGLILELSHESACIGMVPQSAPQTDLVRRGSALVLERLGVIAAQYGVDSHHEVVPTEVLTELACFRINVLWLGLCNPLGMFPVRVPQGKKPLDVDGRSVVVVLPVAVKISSMVLTGAFALRGLAQLAPSQKAAGRSEMVLSSGTVKLLWKQIMRSESWTLDPFTVRLQRAISELEEAGEIVSTPPAESTVFSSLVHQPDVPE